MIILIHVIIALASIVATSFAGLSPSSARLRMGGWLITATFATGTYLVLHLHVPLVQACESGLAYLAVAAAGMLVGYYRLRQLNSVRVSRH